MLRAARWRNKWKREYSNGYATRMYTLCRVRIHWGSTTVASWQCARLSSAGGRHAAKVGRSRLESSSRPHTVGCRRRSLIDGVVRPVVWDFREPPSARGERQWCGNEFSVQHIRHDAALVCRTSRRAVLSRDTRTLQFWANQTSQQQTEMDWMDDVVSHIIKSYRKCIFNTGIYVRDDHYFRLNMFCLDLS